MKRAASRNDSPGATYRLRRGENGWAHELDELLARGELAMGGPVLGELVAGVPPDVTIAAAAARARTTLWSADAVHERVVAAMGDLTLRYERGAGQPTTTTRGR